MDQTEPPSHNQSQKSGNKRVKIRGEKTQSALKVKLPKFRQNVTKEDRTRTDGRILESTRATNGGAGAKCTFESRTVYLPWFGSSEVDEPQSDQTEPRSQSQAHKHWNKRVKTRGEKTWKIKQPKLCRNLTKEDKTPRRWILEPAKTTLNLEGGGAHCAGSDSGSDGRDVFDFSQRPTSKAISEKEKVGPRPIKQAKRAVLRTISRVLEENKLIRQRLAVLRQATEAVLTD